MELRELRPPHTTLADMVAGYGENGNVLYYTVLQVFKPVYEAYAEAYGKRLDDAVWGEPVCYVYGGSPEMTSLEGESER